MWERGSRGMDVPRALFRMLKLPPRLLYAIGLGRIYGRLVLLQTTEGRRTGKPRVTPLQYEKVNGSLVVGSVQGAKADWVRNVVSNPRVEVRVGSSRFSGVAEVSVEPGGIADFLELRLQRHPRMVGGIMRVRGVPRHPDRSQLEEYASHLALVTITSDPPPG